MLSEVKVLTFGRVTPWSSEEVQGVGGTLAGRVLSAWHTR